ncbi:MAG TPA: TRAP transporter large permease [Alphaproteobacteria bacterium]|jgi:tripartite ATP-independent transporter DctM subunit|nr:TRAP transporter large permease [Alphaproteobacteria bacterium]
MIWLVSLAGLAMLAAGAAVAYAFGAASILTFLATDNARYLPILPQRVFSQIDVFALMAMPLFILAGEIMNRAGITRALVDLSMALLGRLKGGLGYVNILTSVFFAGISGSAVADAAALANTLVPAMRARGYSPLYAGAITAAASVIGPIIPPSLVMIFYGAIMQTSVAAMFIGGILPGLLLAAALAIANVYFAHRDDHPGGRDAETPRLLPAFRHAAPSLALPVIILGGIVFGVVTPTEAAGLAVLVAIAVGLYYGGVDWTGLREGIEQTASLTGAIFMILGAVACFGWLAGSMQLPQQLVALVAQLGLGKTDYLLLINLIFIISGMFLDAPVAMALLVPLLAPAAVTSGVDPVHLGIVISLNLTIGFITPPIGASLLVVSAVMKIGYWELARATLPFVFVEVVVLLAIIFEPEITLFLPRLLGFIT